MSGDLAALDVELVEEGLVEHPAAVVGDLAVQLLGMLEQVEGCFEEGGAGVEVGANVLQLLGERLALSLDAVETAPDLGLGQVAVGREVEQVLLLDVELAELSGELFVQELGGLVPVGDRLVQHHSHLLGELAIEADGGVVPEHGLLHDVHVPVGLGTGVLLPAPAEEVEVRAAVALGPGDDHAGFTALVVAASTPQRAFEVVVVFALTLGGGAASIEELLDLVEDLGCHEGLVAALVLDALVGDVAEVVAVPEELGELGVRDGSAGVAPGRSSA